MIQLTGSRFRNRWEPVGTSGILTGSRFPAGWEPVGTSGESGTGSRFPLYREPEPEPVAGTSQTREPVILISSRDNVTIPHVRGALKLAEQARANGWVVKITYALAEVPERRYLNGTVAKIAHRLDSVVVRLQRHTESGWASWHMEEGEGWHFAGAFVDLQRYGWDRSAKIPSILDRVAA